MSYASKLENHPKLVHAIGMLTVEVAVLETALANLLGAIIDLDANTADALYLTPKAAIARIEILENAANARLMTHNTHLAEVLGLCKRAKAVLGKRHNIIHSRFVVHPETSDVYVIELRGKTTNHKQIKVADLEKIILETRTLIVEAIQIVAPIQKLLRRSPRKSP